MRAAGSKVSYCCSDIADYAENSIKTAETTEIFQYLQV
jgi:hypothetical protein